MVCQPAQCPSSGLSTGTGSPSGAAHGNRQFLATENRNENIIEETSKGQSFIKIALHYTHSLIPNRSVKTRSDTGYDPAQLEHATKA